MVIDVPFRLRRHDAAEAVSFWVVTADADGALADLSRTLNANLIGRLEFARLAVKTRSAGPAIALRAVGRPTPPVLAIRGAVGYYPHRGVGGLWLPDGWRLTYRLRADVARRLLAPAGDRVYWLDRVDRGLAVRSAAAAAFRPLAEWVDYRVPAAATAGTPWQGSGAFALLPFSVVEAEPAPAPAADRPPVPKFSAPGARTGRTAVAPQPVPPPPAVQLAVPLGPVPPDQLEIRRKEVEAEFLAVDGPPDDPRRAALWAALAAVYDAQRDVGQAAVCYAHQAWAHPDCPAELSRAWVTALRGEWVEPGVARLEDNTRGKDPGGAGAHETAALFVHLGVTRPAWVTPRLAGMAAWLEANEAKLSARACWLAWWHLARFGPQPDTLMLARARDRLLGRLHERGLSADLDVPRCVRAGSAAAGNWADRIEALARRLADWQEAGKPKAPPLYTPLVAAFALAATGDGRRGRELFARTAWPEAAVLDPAHAFLRDAFRHRLTEAAEGRPHTSDWPAALAGRRTRLDETRQGSGVSWLYTADRMLELSWVLSPRERVDPHDRWAALGGPLARALAELPGRAGDRLPAEVDRLLREHTRPEDRLAVLAAAAPVAYRAGAAWAVTFLGHVGSALAGVKAPTAKHHQLAAGAIELAGHFDLPQEADRFLGALLELLTATPPAAVPEAVERVAGGVLRNLRRLGLQAQTAKFLADLGGSLADDTPAARTARTHLARGLYACGAADAARARLDDALREVARHRTGRPPAVLATAAAGPLFRLVRAYVGALGEAEPAEVFARLDGLLDALPPMSDQYTTAPYFSRDHHETVETAFRSVIEAAGTGGGARLRGWLAEDEYLVRRRVHADLRQALAAAGL